MQTDELDEKDIERVLTMLNSRNIGLLKGKPDEELDSIFYGVRRNLLLIIKIYKTEFYLLLAYLNTNDYTLKRNLKESLVNLNSPNAFISFMEDGTKFSVEDCRMLDLKNVNFFDSVEKNVIKNDAISQKHTYFDTNHAPFEFMKLFGDDFDLNYVQRVVSNVAFNTNDNFIVCAPTGVGKTVISAMRIFKVISEKKHEAKIAYVAPIKALGNEVYDFLSRTFSNVNVLLATSDVEMNHQEIRKSNIIVGTPERIELIVRNTFTSFDLIILDEIHILNDPRGNIIEGLVARVMRLSNTNLIGMSATVYNYEDIAIFLGVPYYNIFYFGEEHRPLPLTYDVVFTDDIDKELDEVLADCELPLVIFVHSQKDTLSTAEHIKQYYDRIEDIHNVIQSERDIDYYEHLHPQLKELVFHRIGIHHSGLDKKTRLIIEAFYKKGILKVLVSTSTLAWGVNLPIHDVIIKGSTYYNPEIGDFLELSNIEIRQMFGRAGRYSGMVGCKGLLISSTTSNLYFNQTIESHILPNICNLVLTEIFLGVTSFKDLIDWFNNTFYMIRLMKYNENAFRLAKDILFTTLIHLKESGMIDGYNITAYGRITVKYFLDYSDVHKFCTSLRLGISEGCLIDLVGDFKEFRNLKGVVDVDTQCSSIFARILTLYLSNKKIDNEIVNYSIGQIEQNFLRVMNAVLELCIAKSTSTSLKVLEIIKAYETRCSTGSSPLRHFNVEKIEEIEKKNIPYKIFRHMKENDFKELSIEGYNYLKYFPNFNIDLQLYCELNDKLIIHIEIEKDFNDTKMNSIKYLFVIRDFYNSIILSDILYLYKEADSYSFFYSIPKRRFIQIEIISYEMINTTTSKAFDLSEIPRAYSVYDFDRLDNDRIFKMSCKSSSLLIHNQFEYNCGGNEIFIVKNKEMKRTMAVDSITHIEFIKAAMNKSLIKNKKYVIINTHEISETYTLGPLISYCKEASVDVELLGYYPLTPIGAGSIFTSHFGGFWSRVYDFTRNLTHQMERLSSLSHLIVVSNYRVIEFLDKELLKKPLNYKIVFFKDIEIMLKPKKISDFVHIVDTQYFDYSSSSLMDYRMDFIYYLCKLGDRSRFYIQESKIALYFQDNDLQLLYKFKNEDQVCTDTYLFNYEVSSQSVSILEEDCKNNMGINAILFLIFQIDELREEVVYPKYKDHKNVELGLKYLKTDYLIKHPQETDESILECVGNVLNLFIDISSKKKHLKTMFNSIFIIQKMNKLQDKFFRIDTDENIELVINSDTSVDYPIAFYTIFDDCSYSLMGINKPGTYILANQRKMMYVLCDKVKGYEVVK